MIIYRTESIYMHLFCKIIVCAILKYFCVLLDFKGQQW